MSHKYYGFKKEEDKLYTIPFLSTKTQRLRFLNEDFVGYGQKNEFIIHKNPGLTIMRINDHLINQGFQKQSNTEKLMNEFLNQLIYQSTASTAHINVKKLNSPDSRIKFKEVSINSNSLIRISLNSL